MCTAYRLLYYEPDPFSEARFLLGALFRQNRRIWGVAAERLPGPGGPGGVASAQLLALLAQHIRSIEREDQAIMGLGPYVHLSEWKVLPDTIENPQDWVLSHILPSADSIDGK